MLGSGDLAALMYMPLASTGSMDTWDEAYPGHRYHYAMARIAVAARAAGIVPLDGPLADFRDTEGLRRMCRIARSLGYDGKWCIHPNQIAVVNEVFSPTQQEIEWARRVVQHYRDRSVAGAGAMMVDDRMIDVASIRMAEATLERAERTSTTSNPSGTPPGR